MEQTYPRISELAMKRLRFNGTITYYFGPALYKFGKASGTSTTQVLQLRTNKVIKFTDRIFKTPKSVGIGGQRHKWVAVDLLYQS
jgi:hypothetical protein